MTPVTDLNAERRRRESAAGREALERRIARLEGQQAARIELAEKRQWMTDVVIAKAAQEIKNLKAQRMEES